MQKILIVDDEELNRELLVELLKQDYEVESAASGSEALDKAAQQTPDLVLLDIRMPEIDGYETCRRLKENPDTAAAPVIFVSANSAEEEILKGYEVGGADYFVKPFQPDQLKIKIAQNLELKQRQEEWAQQVSDATKVAMQALSDTSAYGAIVGFLQDSLQCDNCDEIANRVFETTEQWGLNCTVQLRMPGMVCTRSPGATQKPLEEQVMQTLANQGGPRIFDFGPRTIITYPHSSLLVKNMPVEDSDRYGAYKDYLARLVEGMESRVLLLIANAMIDKRSRQLRDVFSYLLNMFRAIQKRNYQLRLSSAGIVENMNEELLARIAEIGAINELSEESEKQVLQVGYSALAETNQLFSRGLQFEEYTQNLIAQLEQELTGSQEGLSEKTMDNLVRLLDPGNMPELGAADQK